jgi:hypothetical protein
MSTGPNLIDIVGEQVDLTDQSDKSMAPAIVNFSDQYVPGDMTNPDKEKLKTALKRVFKNKNQPPPPCNGADKDLILKSLEGRLEKLRGQRNTASKLKDTAGTRTTIEHIKRLCAFIDRFRKADCDDQDLVYSESSLGELTDSSIDTYLKQFIFVILQSHVPIEDYKEWTEKSKDIMRKIGTMPSDLEEIIQKFEGKIPERLKELINCMKLVPLDAIQKMAGNEIQLLLGKILDRVKKVIPKDDPFWKVVKENDIESIIDALLERIKETNNSDPELIRLKSLFEGLRGNSEELLKQINTLEKEIRTLRDSLKGPSSSQDDVLHQLNLKMKELEALLILLNQQDQQYKANLLVNMSPEQIKHLRSQLGSLEGDVESLSKTKEGLKTSLTEMVSSTDGSSNATLMNINRLSRKALEELRSKNNTLEQQLEELQKLHRKEIAEGSEEITTLKAKHEAEILTLKKENGEYKAYINQLQILNTQLKNEINRLTSLVNSKEAELNTSQNETKSLSEEIDLLKSRIEELVKQFNKTKLVLDKAVSEYEIIGNLLDEIEKDIEILKAESNAKDKKITDLQLKIVSLEASLRNSQAKLKRLEEKSTLFDHLIVETQKLETKLLANDLTNVTIDAFINAIKAKEDELRKCGEDGEKAKASIDAITIKLIEMTKEVEKKKGESVDLKAQADKAAKEAKDAKEAADKALKEAANSKNAATKAAATAATEIAKAKQEAADAIQKANEDAKAAIGTAQEAQKAAEAEKAALQAQVDQANTIASVKQTEADAAKQTLKQAEDQLKNAQSETAKKQAEADLAIAQANEAITAAEARSAEAEAALLKAQQAAKALLQESSSQAEQEAASLAAAEAKAQQAEAAQKVKEAEAAAALAAQQAEQILREAAEQQSGEDKKALEEAAERIREAETRETDIVKEIEQLKEELESYKNNSIDRDALKSIILAFANSSKSYNGFTSEDDADPDLNTLRQVIREQLEQRNKLEDNYKNLRDWLKKGVESIQNPGSMKDDAFSKAPPEIQELISIVKAATQKSVGKEKDLEEFCFLLFFTSHILSTHFNVAERNPIKTGYSQLMANLNETRRYTDLSIVISILTPILNLMEQVYQSGKEGSFFIKPIEFFKDSLGKDLFTFLKGQLKEGLTTEAINKHFAEKTGRLDEGPLSKVYININGQNKTIEIIQNQTGSAKKVIGTGIEDSLSYSSIAQRLDTTLNTVSSSKLSPEPASGDMTLSYPVLFYFLIFTFKNYLNTRQGKLQGTQCRLPRIFQQGQ